MRWMTIVLVLAIPMGLSIGCSEDCDDCPTCPDGTSHILVQPDGSGDYPTIQAAIDAADSLDVIELADGIYTGEGNRDLDFLGKTIIVRSRSGNPLVCVVDCQATEADPHYGCRFVSGESRATWLAGITIRDGYFNSGAGILCDESSPTIHRCRLVNNTAGFLGGGIACGDASPLISHCSFVNNRALAGAGLSYQYGSPSITMCEFSGNYATEQGGGMGGEHGYPVISGCTFTLNGAGEAGGGMRCFYGSVEMADVVFDRNTAVEAGGGLSVEDVELASVTGCEFYGNSAQSGAGIAAAGEITVLLSTFAENSASIYGGAMALAYSATVMNCTLVGNSAFTGAGGIFLGGDGHLHVDRTIIAFSAQGEAFFDGSSATVTLTCCNIYDNDGGDWTGSLAAQLGVANNFSEDPFFCDWKNGQYTLEHMSPCESDTCGMIGAWPTACD